MGNAAAGAGPLPPRPVHPHVHGERRNTLGCHSGIRGSSPRTWGTPRYAIVEPADVRFIPTYMGNARPGDRVARPRPVHPHVHGERGRTQSPPAFRTGSSPRTWGTPPDRRSSSSWYRFIPTYMGNAHFWAYCSHLVAVHPHVHGERVSISSSIVSVDGSSPRTWGTRRKLGMDPLL